MATKTPKQILDDMLKRAKAQPYGILAEVHEIDDAWAKEIRARNKNNRKISKARVRRYRHDAAAGRFVLNGQPVIFSSDGVLADGQHRGEAVIDTEIKIPTLVVVGVPAETRTTMDQGRARTAGDYLNMNGEELGGIAATMARYILAYDASKHSGLKGTNSATNADVIAFFEANQDRVRASAALAAELREDARYHVAAPMLGFLHYILSESEPEKAETYIRQIGKGEGLSDTDAAYAVRAKLLALGRIGATKKAEVILSGWKPFLEGRQLKTIRMQGRLPGI